MLKKYRIKQKGLKREELSLTLGFDNSYISKLERETVNITIDRLEKIANYLDVDIVKIIRTLDTWIYLACISNFNNEYL